VRRLAEAEEHGIPEGPYIVHVGRAARQKRHDVLFEALRRLPKPAQLVCLARNTDKLRRLAHRHGVERRVVLPGFRQNPYPWIRRARLLALSSDFEGMALVLVEAMALGTPVVSTDCPHGPREVLGPALARYLVPPRDPDALAAVMNDVLENPPAIQAPPILEDVDPSAVADRYVALANDLARQENASAGTTAAC
jgi:glycosyltransferase involved in cell wall biosynthesis